MAIPLPPNKGFTDRARFLALLPTLLNDDGTRVGTLNSSTPPWLSVCEAFQNMYPEHALTVRQYMLTLIQTGLLIVPEPTTANIP